MSANALGYGGDATGTWPDEAAARNGGVEARGDGLAPLVWKGLFLTVVTLGIYRFWYKTDLRRWYWRRSFVAGSAFEYRGTARELFVGFLIALALLAPLYILFGLSTLVAEGPLAAALQALAGPAFFLLVQYGFYRSRRYRLTRTVWRGLRFDQRGSPWIYALKSFGWLLVVVLTLGLGFPLMRRALERHRVRNTRFGTAEGAFDAPVGGLLLRWAALLVPGAGLFIAGLGVAVIIFAQNFASGRASDAAMPTVLILSGLLWAALLWPWYRAAEFRTFVGGSRLGPLRLRSTLGAGSIYGIYLKYIAAAVAGIALFGLAVGAIGYGAMRSGRFSPEAATTGVALLMPLYLLLFLFWSALKELILNQGFWRAALDSLSIEDLAELDGVLATSVADEAATGEGFADALDFGGV